MDEFEKRLLEKLEQASIKYSKPIEDIELKTLYGLEEQGLIDSYMEKKDGRFVRVFRKRPMMKDKVVTTRTIYKKPTVWGYGDVTYCLQISSIEIPTKIGYPPEYFSFKEGDEVKVTIEKVK